MNKLHEALSSASTTISNLLQKTNRINEQNTKAILIEPLLLALGWNVHDLDEVQREYRYKEKDNPVDYACFVLHGHPRLFVEAKAFNADLKERKWRAQIVNYANTTGVEWCVLTNGVEWQLYKSNAPGELNKKMFLETSLNSDEKSKRFVDPDFFFSLLSKDKIKENEIENYWKKIISDRRCKEALHKMLEGRDTSLVNLIKRKSKVTKNEVEGFLSRSKFFVEILADSIDAKEKKKKSKRKKPPIVKNLPSQKEIEMPLLKVLLRRGGSVNMREHGKEIYEELADFFKLSATQRTTMLHSTKTPVWNNRVQWVRQSLVQKGEIDGSVKGVWTITEKGKKRLSQSK